MSVPESRQGQRPRMNDAENNTGVEVRPATNADYSELPAPTQVSSGSNTGKPPVKSALKKPAGQAAGAAPPSQGTTATVPNGSLLNGQFDEGESHSGFLDALKAWRGEPTAPEETTKSVKFEGEGGAAGAKKNFFANLGGAEFNAEKLQTGLPTFTDGGQQPDVGMSDPKYGPKDSCWQCYKLYPVCESVICSISQKKFCKAICLQRYETDNIISCQLKSDSRTCTKKFVKSTGIFTVGKWCCTEACINDDVDIKIYNDLEEKNSRMLADQDADLSEEGEIDL